MYGGWGGFGGYQDYGEWDGTIVEKILPVKILWNEDSVDMTFHMEPKKSHLNHPVFKGLNMSSVPPLKGYNKVKNNGKILAVNSETGDPILVVGHHGKGRVLALASNPAGGWGMEFVEWESFGLFIRNMAAWSSQAS